jgi:imidazolonepropionase-like amidohydrolase
MDTLIKGATLIDGTGAKPESPGALLVREGRIAARGAEALALAAPDAGVIDLAPYTLVPGLVDCHVHLIWSGAPGALWSANAESDEWLLLRATANAQKALRAGITTVRDCGGRGTTVLNLARAIREGMVAGPRIVASGAPITTTGGHCYYLGLEAEGIDAVRRALREMHRAGADFIKVMVTGGGGTPGSNVRASQFTREELRAMAEDAHRLGKRIAGHVHGTQGIAWAAEAGFDSLEHCSWLALEGVGRDYDERVAEQIVRQGVYVCRTIAGFERWGLEELGPGHRAWEDFRVLRNMVHAGVRLIAGTDAGIDQTDFQGLAATLETMVGLGEMTAAQALDAATRAAAEALGLGGEIGTLEVGKRADLIAVRGNPLEDVRSLREVKAVMRDGRQPVR